MWILLGLLIFLLLLFWVHEEVLKSMELQSKPTPTEKPDLTQLAQRQRSPSARIRYLASCPSCGERLTRRNFFTWQIQIRRKCRNCHTALKSNLKLDTIWSLIGVSPFGVCFYLALVGGRVSWLVVIAALLLHFIAGYILFPYVTKLEIADEFQKPNVPTPMA